MSNESERFESLLMDYFSIGVAQGKEGRAHDDEAFSAQETHLRLVKMWKAARAQASPQGLKEQV